MLKLHIFKMSCFYSAPYLFYPKVNRSAVQSDIYPPLKNIFLRCKHILLQFISYNSIINNY